MLSSINFWMCLAGFVYLAAGACFAFRKEMSASRGWDKLIALGPLFIAVSLAVFAPEHFGGPMDVKDMIPVWMPWHLFWAYFVGFALFLAAAASFCREKVRKHVRYSDGVYVLSLRLPCCIYQLCLRIS